MAKRTIIISAVVIAGISFLLIMLYHLALRLPTTNQMSEYASQEPADDRPVVFVGVVSRFAPSLIFRGYQPIMDHLSHTTPYRFELRLKPSYSETIDDLVNGNTDIAFIGSLIYVSANRDHGIVPILAPLNAEHRPISRAVVIARADAHIPDLFSLPASTIALPSDHSFSANWFTSLMQHQNAGQSSTALSFDNFSYHHSVVFKVLKGEYEAGVVKEWIASEYEDRGIRILMRSPEIPASPIVVRKNHNPAITESFIRSLLSVDPADISKTTGWDREFVHGVTRVTHADYANLAAMISQFERKQP